MRNKTGQFIKSNSLANDKNWLYQKYVIERISWNDFYKIYGVSPDVLRCRLKEFNLKRKNIAWNKNTKGIMKPNKTSFKKGDSKPINAFKYKKGSIPSKEHINNQIKGIIESYRNGRIPCCPMLGKKHSLDTKIKISKSRKGKIKGINHHNWKGGITPEEMLIRESLEYRIWKLEVYKRDRGFCQICGRRCNNNNIVAHHIKPFSDYPELRFDIDNGITLCRSCHKKIHSEIGKEYRFQKLEPSLNFK